MTNDKMREEFEAWVRRDFDEVGICEADLRRDETGEYLCQANEAAWRGWRASRAAVIVELPDNFSPNDCGEWAMWQNQIVEAIEAEGLKVKL